MIRLSCVAQNYAWGKPADESMVAALLVRAGHRLELGSAGALTLASMPARSVLRAPTSTRPGRSRSSGALWGDTFPYSRAALTAAPFRMGTHPSGPSRVAADDQPLSDYIEVRHAAFAPILPLFA